VIIPASSTGLFKIDFGHFENDRSPLDADGNPLASPPPLTNWNVIPTWTFLSPNDLATNGATLQGTASPDNTAVTWHVTDWSTGSTNVTLTIKDNTALNASGGFADATGMTANNPTKKSWMLFTMESGSAIVKDDYLYRARVRQEAKCCSDSGNIAPGKYNVTVFMGRTSDGDGQFGKIWVDDANGANEPTAQNTDDYGSKDLINNAPIPTGQAQNGHCDIKANQSLWFGYMEDSTGGISGMIIRGIASQSTERPTLSMAKAADGSLTLTYTGKLYSSDTANGTFAIVSNASSPYKVTRR